MNTANKLTMLRIVLIPVFMVLLELEFATHMWWALGIFVVASVTDFVDGYVARHYNQITDFGKFMDPLADKILVMAAMVWFVQEGRMAAWVLLLVILREFAVTALRLVAVEGGRVIAAGWSGKVKTVATMVCLVVMLIVSFPVVDVVCSAIILVTTLYSGMEYCVKNKDVLNWNDM